MAYPIGPSAQSALDQGAARARTAEEAARLDGGPVRLEVELLPGKYATPQEAEAAFPALYDDLALDLVYAEKAWRVAARYWKPLPALPVARDLAAALAKPLAHARTKREAEQALGVAAELAHEPLAKSHRTAGYARAARRSLVERGLADVIERDGLFYVAVKYWRPAAPVGALAPAERANLQERAAAPLTGPSPQLSPFVGLFERLAPENDAIVLVADEGDGRFRGE